MYWLSYVGSAAASQLASACLTAPAITIQGESKCSVSCIASHDHNLSSHYVGVSCRLALSWPKSCVAQHNPIAANTFIHPHQVSRTLALAPCVITKAFYWRRHLCTRDAARNLCQPLPRSTSWTSMPSFYLPSSVTIVSTLYSIAEVGVHFRHHGRCQPIMHLRVYQIGIGYIPFRQHE